MIDIADITVPVVIGVIGTFIMPIMKRVESSNVKRWLAIGLVVCCTGFVGVTWLWPAGWEQVATWIAFAVSAMQVAYAALKPTGIFDVLTDLWLGSRKEDTVD